MLSNDLKYGMKGIDVENVGFEACLGYTLITVRHRFFPQINYPQIRVLVQSTGKGNLHRLGYGYLMGTGPGCLFGTRAKTRTRWPGVTGTGVVLLGTVSMVTKYYFHIYANSFYGLDVLISCLVSIVAREMTTVTSGHTHHTGQQDDADDDADATTRGKEEED